MPQCDLSYSSDVALDAPALLARIEQVICAHDGKAGACKGRAIPVDQFHHSHVLADIALLPHAHRDAAFMAALKADLFDVLRAAVDHSGCWVSLRLDFLPTQYQSEQMP